MTVNEGEAELVLNASEKSTVSEVFLLAELKDNQYKIFEFEPGDYPAAKIVSRSGSGVSVWSAYEGGDILASCLVYRYADGSTQITPGCIAS